MKTFNVYGSGGQGYMLNEGGFGYCCAAGQCHTLGQLLSWDNGICVLLADEKLELPENTETTNYGVFEFDGYFLHYKLRLKGEKSKAWWYRKRRGRHEVDEKVFSTLGFGLCYSWELDKYKLPNDLSKYILTISGTTMTEYQKTLMAPMEKLLELKFTNLKYRDDFIGHRELTFNLWKNGESK